MLYKCTKRVNAYLAYQTRRHAVGTTGAVIIQYIINNYIRFISNIKPILDCFYIELNIENKRDLNLLNVLLGLRDLLKVFLGRRAKILYRT